MFFNAPATPDIYTYFNPLSLRHALPISLVEPSLQAAFVEYGGNRHGFLAFSEIHPDYYQIPIADRQRLLAEQAAEEALAAAEEEAELDAAEARAAAGGNDADGGGDTGERKSTPLDSSH